MTVPSFVANDTILIGGIASAATRHEHDNGIEPQIGGTQKSSVDNIEAPSMLIITGPNYSGKSVYLKQVALIVYLAHIGCFVPAANAIIGLTDKILTRVATRETVSKFQSAFMIDLQQVAHSMNIATHRSLVIVDEFGKGTESNGRRGSHG